MRARLDAERSLSMPAPANAAATLCTVMIGVHDVDRATAFYDHTLGLTLRGRSGGHAVFDAGGLTLVLSAELAKLRSVNGAMPVEFTFRVEHLKTAIEQLLRAGVELHADPQPLAEGDWHCTFDDPDGHRLSLLGKMTEEDAKAIQRPSNMMR